MRDHELTDGEAIEVGHQVREQLARRRLSRQALADMAKISLSTLEKALTGARPFTLATTIRLEEALGVSLHSGRPAVNAANVAPEYMGAYTRPAVRWIEGRYLTLRPSFGTPGGIYSYIITIRWIDEVGHLGFAESQRLDAGFEQGGHVSMPTLSGHIYLVTNEAGQYRMMVLGRPTIDGRMFGILTTLQVGHGSQLVPISAPVALMKLDGISEPVIGRVIPDSSVYSEYRTILNTAIGQDFVRFHQ